MKIIITDTKTVLPLATLILSGSNPMECPGDLRINGQRVIETADFLRAEYVQLFDRKNRKNTFTFHVTRLHADEFEAQMFMLDHDANMPVIVDVRIEITGGRPAKSAVRYLHNAAIDSHNLSMWNGATTVYEYSIIAGQILKTKP